MQAPVIVSTMETSGRPVDAPTAVTGREGMGKLDPGPLSSDLMLALERVEAEVWEDVYRAASAEDVEVCGIRVEKFGPALLMMASCVDVLGLNRVVGLEPGGSALKGVLNEIMGRYDSEGVPRFFVQLTPAALSPVLQEWLSRHGLRHYNNWVKLFRGIEPPPEAVTDLHVREVGPEHASDFARIVAVCFGWPEVVQPWISRFVGRAGWRHYMAFEGDIPVATGALHVRDGYGYLGPAATLPDYRGRGAQGALLSRRIRDAASQGCRLLVTETAEDRPERPAQSYRNMLRFGFQVAYIRPNYICGPGLCP